jgi:SAM-dependent methyltransferase
MRNSTRETFKDKWEHNSQLAFEETSREGSDIFSWILGRNGFRTSDELKEYLKDKRRLLDAGCGNGRVTALLRRYSPDATEVVGIDLVSSKIAQQNLEAHHLCYNVTFLRRDLLDDLKDLGKFDFVYCEEVLHHILDAEKGFRNLCKLLSPGGEIAIYVYKRKAPVREYVDDYVRGKISELTYEEAMRACKQITELGRSLSQRGIKIQVPRVDALEIEEGEYDLQRFIYHFFTKCFWNPGLTFEENAAINFDWYHPQIASRHTLEEVREWFIRAKLRITHEHSDFYGITLRGKLA